MKPAVFTAVVETTAILELSLSLAAWVNANVLGRSYWNVIVLIAFGAFVVLLMSVVFRFPMVFVTPGKRHRLLGTGKEGERDTDKTDPW